MRTLFIVVLLLGLNVGAWAQASTPKPKHKPAPTATVPNGVPVQQVNGVPVRYQAPINNPNTNYRSGNYGHHQKLQWTGVVTARQLERLQIAGPISGQTQKIDFSTDGKTKFGKNVKEGSRVLIDYDGTPEAGVYRVMNVQVYSPKKPLPKLTAPVVKETR